MQIHTIEMNYDYRIKEITKRLIDRQEKKISDFKNGNQLFDFIWNNRENLGELLYDDMVQFMAEDEWLDEIK